MSSSRERLALVSDIHGNLAALEAVAADIAARGIAQVANLGDSLAGPLLPLETARFLMATDWAHLAGNHERQMLGPRPMNASDAFALSSLSEAEIEWMRSLPASLRPSPAILLCHGSPRRDDELLLESIEGGGNRLASADEVEERLGGEAAAVVACGHSHFPRAVRSRSGQLHVNPGSVGLPAYEDEGETPYVMETGSPDARYAVLERTAAGWIAALIAVPYDHATMAKLAARNGRPEWARALLAGRAR